MDPRRIAALTAVTLVTALGTTLPPVSASAATGPRVTHDCLDSVPEPGTTEKVKICFTLFKPTGASRQNKVPMVMHSHGWGGARTKDPAAFSSWLEAGFGVLSFDQRGFGESGGKAHVENPAYEGRDVQRLVARIARMPWVRKDEPGDPRLGAIGGSYGGGYQLLGAFEPVVGEKRRIELPSVAVDVPAGQKLLVLATPLSDTFAGMGSRTPGLIVLEDAVVRLPVVG